MKNLFFTSLIFIFCCSFFLTAQPGCKHNNRSVFFGERSVQIPEASENTVRIFIDKNGVYYPDFFISDKELENNCSSLKEWYKANPAKLNLICLQYKIDSTLTFENKIKTLNDSVAQIYARNINIKSKSHKRIDILIHGFRKKVYGKIDASSHYSLDENTSLKKKLQSDTTQKIFFIEVYYDCKFATPAQCYKHRGFELFESCALSNADNVGLALRKIIPAIEKQNINIITHSVGARVACELLFNASKGALPEEKDLPTPSQSKIKICLLAPAIGYEQFNEYFSRNTNVDFKSSDNYKLMIVYNENDFVLLKHYGFGVNSTPTDYGNTSLGCNHQGDLQKLKQLFSSQFPKSAPPELFDFSVGNSGMPLGCHLLSCYFRHKEFLNVMKLFGE